MPLWQPSQRCGLCGRKLKICDDGGYFATCPMAHYNYVGPDNMRPPDIFPQHDERLLPARERLVNDNPPD